MEEDKIVHVETDEPEISVHGMGPGADGDGPVDQAEIDAIVAEIQGSGE